MTLELERMERVRKLTKGFETDKKITECPFNGVLGIV